MIYDFFYHRNIKHLHLVFPFAFFFIKISRNYIRLNLLSAPIKEGLQASGIAVVINIILAVTKIMTGVIGNSYALVADGIESTTDILSSFLVWSGLRISAKPPDSNHPFGHGKAESLAGMFVSLFLMGAAVLIAVQSVSEIRTPHHAPEWYTLVVLSLIIIIKEALYRFEFRVGKKLKSTSLKSDAWHHRSDALTSLAAFIGISIALIGGKGFESADDWAALLACSVIIYNGIRLFRPAVDEVMDAMVSEEIENRVRAIAQSVEGVIHVEKCRIRKSGTTLLMDIHITVEGKISVREGHEIGHKVKDSLIASTLDIEDVMVHVEPDDL